MRRNKGELLIECDLGSEARLCASQRRLSGKNAIKRKPPAHSATIRLEPVEIGLVIGPRSRGRRPNR